MEFNLTVVQMLLPEIVLVACGTWIVLGSTFTPSRWGWSVFALAACLVSGAALYRQLGFTIDGVSLWAGFLHGQAREFGPLEATMLSTVAPLNSRTESITVELTSAEVLPLLVL